MSPAARRSDGCAARSRSSSSTLLSALALFAAGRSGGKVPEGVRLAAFIALGIGIHNFGEGLAVGAALATGAAALATFLVVGFAIHNVSEGFGIAVPLIGRRPQHRDLRRRWRCSPGLPAVPGVWLGSQAVSPFWIALCFGIGAGAILQVIVEVLALLARRERRRGADQRREPRPARRSG